MQKEPLEMIDANRSAYKTVLNNAGTILPKRDKVDERVISDVRSGNATYEGHSYALTHKISSPGKPCGIIDSQRDVGGWPTYHSTPAPTDSDHDGMPDTWEDAKGLNSGDPSDRNMLRADGYTMLEHYLNPIGI